MKGLFLSTHKRGETSILMIQFIWAEVSALGSLTKGSNNQEINKV